MSRSAMPRLVAGSGGETVPQEYRILAQHVQERNTAKAPERRGTVQWPRAKPDLFQDLSPEHELDDLREKPERLVARGTARGLLETGWSQTARPCNRSGSETGQGLANHVRLDGRDGSWVNTAKPVNGVLVCRDRTRVQAPELVNDHGRRNHRRLDIESSACTAKSSFPDECVYPACCAAIEFERGFLCRVLSLRRVTIGSPFGRIPEFKTLVAGASPTAEGITRDDRQRRSIQAWGPCGR